MKKTENKLDPTVTLRQRAEELFSKKTPKSASSTDADIETMEVLHELEVYQIELEMQNEELMAANYEAEETAEKYAELYNFAPTGYFTLNQQSEIIELNRYGSHLLGHADSYIRNRRFDIFISEDSRSLFYLFLDNIFKGKANETCDITLVSGKKPIYVHLTGIKRENTEQCLVNVTDITELKSAEDKLNEAHLLLRSSIESAQDMIILSIDMHYKYLLFNTFHKEVMLNTYGIDIKKGMNLLNCITNDDDRKKAKLNFDRALAGEGHITYEEYGAIDRRYYETHYNPIINEKNEVIGTTAFSTNVTERTETERALRENRAKLEAALANMSDAVFISDIHGNFIEFNEAFATFYRFKNKDECPRTFAEYPEVIDAYLPNGELATHDMWAVPRALSGEKVTNTEYFLRRKDTGETWSGSYSFSPIWDVDGVIVGSVVVARDITEQKKAQKKLNDSEKKLSTLFGAMTEMVVMHELVFDKKGEVINYRITDCNKAFTETLGIKREEAIGKLATEVYQSEAAPFLEIFAQVGMTGEPYEFNIYYPPFDKQLLISVVSPDKNNFATITNDITDIQKIQEIISDKNRELENYLYVASHDLRSPLVNIQGFSQRLQKQSDEIKKILSKSKLEQQKKESIDKIIMEDMPKTLNFIMSNVSKMDSLIKSLLEISRTGRLMMSIQKVDMNQLLTKILAAFNFQITELAVRVKKGQLADCYGDETQLNQLFSNIIDNAIKYRDKSRPLEIGIKSVVKYHQIIYSISDTGKGMKASDTTKVWDMFYRVDPTAAAEAGDGIGLNLAKRITNKHKGKIWVESEEGKGSTFYIELQKEEFAE